MLHPDPREEEEKGGKGGGCWWVGEVKPFSFMPFLEWFGGIKLFWDEESGIERKMFYPKKKKKEDEDEDEALVKD